MLGICTPHYTVEPAFGLLQVPHEEPSLISTPPPVLPTCQSLYPNYYAWKSRLAELGDF
jgi:hypothetical protein